MNADYKQKYLKYKLKYIELKKLYGGETPCGIEDKELCTKMQMLCASNDPKKCTILHNLGCSNYFIKYGANLNDTKFRKMIELKSEGKSDIDAYYNAQKYKPPT
jgi:hypothetical protein